MVVTLQRIVACLAPSATVGKLAPHDIIHEAFYCDTYARSFTKSVYMQDDLCYVTALRN